MALTGTAGVIAANRKQEPEPAADDTRALLEARSLYRFYRVDDEETMALQGVSLQVWPGEMVVVAGPSGSGKSTLLACLAGLDEPSGGAAYVNGARMSHRPEAVRARLRARHVGVLSQQGNLFPHLTVVANIGLAQSLAGQDRRHPGKGRRDSNDLVTRLGIAARSHALPAQLSGGEAARAALAVALANDPAVLIADEPTGELDSANEARLIGLLLERARSGHAVLVASHSPAVIRRADRIITLLDGRVTS
jgi:putative ABC transport system ATP-binding protein